MATYSKPAKVARWADAGVIVEPAESKKDSGWVAPELPPDTYFNWYQNLVGLWLKWFDERHKDGGTADEYVIHGPDLTGTDADGGTLSLQGGSATGDGASDIELKAVRGGQGAGATPRAAELFLGLYGATDQLYTPKDLVVDGSGNEFGAVNATGKDSTTQPGVFGQGGSSGAYGLRGLGTATSAGVFGMGGNTAGAPGVSGSGGLGGGPGVTGAGTGTNGVGVQGTGSSGGAGVAGTGNGAGAGVAGTGGGSSGPGVTGTAGAGNASGVVGTGSGTGAGVFGTGGAIGNGLVGTGGSTSGAGVYGQNSTASDVIRSNAASSTGHAFEATTAASPNKGHMRMTPASADPSTRVSGTLSAESITNKASYDDGTLLEFISRKRLTTIANSTQLVNPTSSTVFDQSYTIPANSLRVGSVIRMRAWGQGSRGVAGYITFQTRLGGTNVVLARSADLNSGGFFWEYETTMIVRALGGAGVATFAIFNKLHPGSIGSFETSDNEQYMQDQVDASNPNTTVAQALQVAVSFNGSNPNNNITMRGFLVEIA